MKAFHFLSNIFPKNILINTSFLVFERVFAMFLSLIVSIYIARYLAPEQYGLLNYSLSLVSLFIPFSKMAYDTIVVRDLLVYPNQQNIILGTAFVLRFWGGLFCLGLILLGTYLWIVQPVNRSIVLIISLITLGQAFYVIDFYFQAQVDAKYTVYSRSIAAVGSALWSLSLIFIKGTLIYFAFSYLIHECLIVIGLIYFFQKKSGVFTLWKFDRQNAQKQFKASLPLIFSLVVISINLKIDQVLIDILLGHESVGKYAAAAKISEVWYFLPAALLSSYFPDLVNRIRDQDFVKQQTVMLCSILFYVSLGVALFTTVSAEYLVGFIFGEAYASAASVLKIHIWAGVFIFIGQPISKILIAKNLEVYHLYGKSLAALLNVLLNLWLIPLYQIQGAAWSTLISYAVASFFSYGLFPKTRAYFFWQSQAVFKPIQVLLKFLS